MKLDKHARGTELGAVKAILEAKEVQAAMKRIWGLFHYISSALPITPTPYPSEIKDVTFDQALDAIARAWDGVPIYGACATRDNSCTKLSTSKAESALFQKCLTRRKNDVNSNAVAQKSRSIVFAFTCKTRAAIIASPQLRANNGSTVENQQNRQSCGVA